MRAPAGLPLVLGGRQGLPFDELHHLLEAGVDAAVVIALAEGGPDGLRDDAVAHGIGQDTLETIADLDAHAVIVPGNDQQRAVIHLVPAELPLIDHPDRVLLDLLRFGRRHEQQRELRALGGLERRELLLERALLLRAQGTGEIGDARRQLRDRLQALCARWERWGRRGRRHRPKAQQRQRQSRPRSGAARAGGHFVAGCPGDAAAAAGAAGAPGGEVSKLTVGAVAICCSLATWKLGFTWKPNIFAVRLTGKERTVTL